jgi:hypothetical protein
MLKRTQEAERLEEVAEEERMMGPDFSGPIGLIDSDYWLD